MTEKLRKKLPKKINGRKVAELLTFDGLKILLDNDEWLLLRPSGTEPKIKVYKEAVGNSLNEANATTDTLKKDISKLMGF